MNNDFDNENKKIKENKEATKADGYEEEDEAMENSMEDSGMEEEESSAGFLPHFDVSAKSHSSCFETEPENERDGDSFEKRQKLTAKERWLSVTGRKPRSIPKVRKLEPTDSVQAKVFFGDRRPAQVEKARRLKWAEMIKDEVYRTSSVNYGVVTREIRLPFSSECVWAVRYHPSAQLFAAAYRNGGVQVRNSANGQVVRNLKTLEAIDRLPIRAIRYHPRDADKVYVGGAAGCTQVFDLETGNGLAIGPSVSQISNMDFTANGDVLVIGGRDGVVSLLDPLTLTVLSKKERPKIEASTGSEIDEEYHKLRVYGVKCHPEEANLFATGGWDRTVKIWDVRIPGAVRSINGPWICGDGLDIVGDTILTASWVCENSLQFWSFSSGHFISTVPVTSRSNRFDGEFPFSAQFFNDHSDNSRSNPDVVALGGSGFNEVVVIQVPTGKVVASFPAYKPVIALDTRRGLIAYGGKESVLRTGQLYFPRKMAMPHH